jgi:hypothetical protein
VLKGNKRDCLKDLRSSIDEYLNGNPYQLVRNMREKYGPEEEASTSSKGSQDSKGYFS